MTPEEIRFVVSCAIKTMKERAYRYTPPISLNWSSDEALSAPELTRLLTNIKQHKVEEILGKYLVARRPKGRNSFPEYALPQIIRAIIMDHYIEGRQFVPSRQPKEVKKALRAIDAEAEKQILEEANKAQTL